MNRIKKSTPSVFLSPRNWRTTWSDSPDILRRLVLLLTLMITFWAAYKVARTFLLVQSVISDARELSALAENGSLTLLQSSPTTLTTRLRSLSSDLRDLRTEAGPFSYGGVLFWWLPRYGGEATQASTLLEYADATADGAYTSLVLFERVSADIDAGRAQGKSVGVAALGALQRHSYEVQKAQDDMTRARAARNALDLPRLGESTRSLVERLDRLFPLWSTAVSGFALAPTLLGADRPQDFLLVIQNSDELRATGGFISSVIKVRMNKGDISSLEYHDSYDMDNINAPHPAAPAPLRQYMDANYWVFRDGNWSPDFPTTAKQLLNFYETNQSGTAAGVIATNLNMLAGILQTLGPIDVPGTGTQVTASNALSIIQANYDSPQGQGHTADWWAHRKDFAGKLMVSALEKIRNGQFDKTQFVHLLSDAIASKELLVYLTDPRGEGLVTLSGWDGSLSALSGDSLMIVDSNVGFNKVDPNIHRTADYKVNLDSSGNATSQLALTYTNANPKNASPCIHKPYYPPTYAELQQGCYWDYVRIVGAANARLTGSTSDIQAGTDDPINGRSVFSGYFVLPRGENREIRYDMELPRVVADGHIYRLHIERQPGAPVWSVHVSVTLPSVEGVESTPPPSRQNGNVLEYNLTLDQDLDIVIARPAPLFSNFNISVASAVLSITLVGLWLARRKNVIRAPGARPLKSI